MTCNLDADLAFAIHLQEQFNNESSQNENSDIVLLPAKVTNNNEAYNPIDNSLELIDPTPDIRMLFREYDKVYFWGKLTCCEVKWSERMTLCAGMCHYEGRGGLCSIRLSAPLLKLRPRKDLVETLLHEMIHAYLFVTNNFKDHDAHGPEFLKHMRRINNLSGTNITVYHSFHDEVDNYRQHWWQCDGPCKNKRPYFGLVKRSTNRAPSHNDKWWDEHQKTCNGVFRKIKSPSNHTMNTKRKTKPTIAADEPPAKENKSNVANFQPFSGRGYLLGSPCGSSQPKMLSMLPSTADVIDLTKECTGNYSPTKNCEATAANLLKTSPTQKKVKWLQNPGKQQHRIDTFFKPTGVRFPT